MLLEQVKDLDLYPVKSEGIQMVQTHLSIVALLDADVYKFKKPITLPFADFSSLQQRLEFCRREVALNRRLCPDTYLGVALLTEVEGKLQVLAQDLEPDAALPENVQLVDCAVHMRRLPQDRMMDRLLTENAVSVEHILALAQTMARFHKQVAKDTCPETTGSPKELRGFALANFEETREFCPDVFQTELHQSLQAITEEDFETILPTLEARQRAGRVVDGHGDLHARNICLTDPPTVYDCLEFATALRCADVATENAFLAMDLRYRGHPELAERYLAAYQEESGDSDQQSLIAPLIVYRAMVRAKVSAFLSRQQEVSEQERDHALDSARKHLFLAAAVAAEERRPSLIVFCGLPGCGKSYLSRALTQSTCFPQLSTDRIRKQQAGVAPEEHLPPEAYTPENSAHVYRVTLQKASEALRRGPVLVDAGFRTKQERSWAKQCADRHGGRLLVIWLTASEEDSKRWLAQRALKRNAVSDASWQEREKLKREFVPPNGAEEGFDVLQLRAGGAPWHNVATILTELLGQPRKT